MITLGHPSGGRQAHLNLCALLLQGQRDRGVAAGPAAGHRSIISFFAKRTERHWRIDGARESSASPRSLRASASEKRGSKSPRKIGRRQPHPEVHHLCEGGFVKHVDDRRGVDAVLDRGGPA